MRNRSSVQIALHWFSLSGNRASDSQGMKKKHRQRKKKELNHSEIAI